MDRHLFTSRPAEDRTFEAVEVTLGAAVGIGLGIALGGVIGAVVGGVIGAIIGATLGEEVERLAGPAATTMDATTPR